MANQDHPPSEFFKTHWFGIFLSSILASIVSSFLYDHSPSINDIFGSRPPLERNSPAISAPTNEGQLSEQPQPPPLPPTGQDKLPEKSPPPEDPVDLSTVDWDSILKQLSEQSQPPPLPSTGQDKHSEKSRPPQDPIGLSPSDWASIRELSEVSEPSPLPSIVGSWGAGLLHASLIFESDGTFTILWPLSGAQYATIGKYSIQGGNRLILRQPHLIWPDSKAEWDIQLTGEELRVVKISGFGRDAVYHRNR